MSLGKSWIVLAATTVTLSVAPAAAQAASNVTTQSETAQDFAIPAGPLGDVLGRFAGDASVVLSFDPAVTRDFVSPGLRGRYTVTDGFARLLSEHQLRAVRDEDGNYRLEPLPPRATMMRPVKVQATVDDAANGSAENGYRTDIVSQVGPWQGRTLQDTPYSITVISKDLIENLQATSPDQIYRVAPTVHFVRPQSLNDQSQVYLRGFRVFRPTYRDGLPSSNNGHGTTVEDAESVEILSGLSGFLYGPGNVGGMINYVSRRPTLERLNRVTFGSNGGSNYYAHGDFGGPIDDAGRFGYRINAARHDGESVIDNQDIARRFASGAFDWHLTDTLSWQVDAAYHDYQVDGGQAGWSVTRGARRPSADDIDAGKSWGQQWTSKWFESRRYGTQLRWEANDAFTLRAGWQRARLRRNFFASTNVVQPDGTYTQTVNSAWYAPGIDDLDSETVDQVGQVFADVQFETGTVTHKLTTGVQHSRTWLEGYTSAAPNIVYTGLTLARPSYFDRPAPASTARGPYGRKNDQSYTSLLIGDDIALNRQWSLLAGVAHSTIDIDATAFFPTSAYRKAAVTPNASLVYKPVEAVSAYVTYIESLERGNVAAEVFNGMRVTNAGAVLEPLISDQIEAGLKWSLGEMLLTTALFQIDKALQYYDLRNAAAPVLVQDGRQVHRGIELTAFGKLTNDLTLTAGFTLLDAEVKEQKQNPAIEGKRPPAVAETIAKLRAEYRLPFLPQLSLSGAIGYAGHQFGDESNTDRMPSYTLVDAGARYETAVAQRPLTLRLDVNNLTDKAYWSWGESLGTPRTVLFSVSAEF